MPMAIVLAGATPAACALAARGGQFDDLDTPAVRVLHDDVEGA